MFIYYLKYKRSISKSVHTQNRSNLLIKQDLEQIRPDRLRRDDFARWLTDGKGS
jgi:hypothetical protein